MPKAPTSVHSFLAKITDFEGSYEPGQDPTAPYTYEFTGIGKNAGGYGEWDTEHEICSDSFIPSRWALNVREEGCSPQQLPVALGTIVRMWAITLGEKTEFWFEHVEPSLWRYCKTTEYQAPSVGFNTFTVVDCDSNKIVLDADQDPWSLGVWLGENVWPQGSANNSSIIPVGTLFMYKDADAEGDMIGFPCGSVAVVES